ncbi:hypothetical protein AB0F71_35200 [Kitasatospora sp. NPDC028055]|uniref:hypothetical protein n=1 Tax=Kitasatospora sp. NPDC028055 TaxID=3155653 RepID=UPI0033D10AB3
MTVSMRISTKGNPFRKSKSPVQQVGLTELTHHRPLGDIEIHGDGITFEMPGVSLFDFTRVMLLCIAEARRSGKSEYYFPEGEGYIFLTRTGSIVEMTCDFEDGAIRATPGEFRRALAAAGLDMIDHLQDHDSGVLRNPHFKKLRADLLLAAEEID